MSFVSYWDDAETETIKLVTEFARGAIDGIHNLVEDDLKEFYLEDAWLSFSEDIDINVFWSNSEAFDGTYGAIAYPVVNQLTDTTDELSLFGVTQSNATQSRCDLSQATSTTNLNKPGRNL